MAINYAALAYYDLVLWLVELIKLDDVIGSQLGQWPT